MCRAGSSESEQLDASREGSQAGKAGSSAPDTAKVAGPPREADRGNAGAPAPPTPPTLIQVYAGVGKRRRSAHFDVASSRVIIEVPLHVPRSETAFEGGLKCEF